MDLVYKKAGSRELMLTYLPPINKSCKLAPLYFLIPGGGWHHENRESMFEFSADSVNALRKKGFSAVSIDYRVTSDGITNMYNILEDCFDALCFIADNADKLKIDKNNISLSGHSAGGYLALMLGYCDCALFSKNKKDYTIRSIAAMSPPTVLYDNKTHRLQGGLEAAFKKDSSETALKAASPVEYVSKDVPATLLIAGTSDWLVYANSAEILYDKLKACGAKCELLLSVCGGHCFEKVIKTIEPNPNITEIQMKITEFCIKYSK